MQHDADISWQLLRRIVQDWAGTSAELTEVKPLVGGCINTTLGLSLRDGAKAVLKIATHRVDRNLQREAYQLNMLRDMGFPVPRVYAWKLGSLDDPHSFLLMEFMPGLDLNQVRARCSEEEYSALQTELADLIVRLHQHKAESYQRVADGEGGTHDQWPKFYRSIYDPIWHEAEKTGNLPVKCKKQMGRVHERLERLITHEDCPRLVHWDIWGTNLLADQDENGRWHITAILDPNCKYAHTEAEIAYMELFHTITPAFLKQYQQTFRLPGEYHRIRKAIYQLYPLINHLNLFGQEYLKPLIAAVERTTALV